MKKIALTIVLCAGIVSAYAQTDNTGSGTGTPNTQTSPNTITPNGNGTMNNDGTIQTPSDNPANQTNPNEVKPNQKTQPIAPDQKSKNAPAPTDPIDPNKNKSIKK